MIDRPLRANSLSFVEVLAASIALIGLSMTPVLIAPYLYASAGNAAWMAYVFGGVMLFFVALNLNVFTRRSSGAGSIFGYAAANLGPVTGALAGWSLLWAYVFVGAANLGAMGLFVQQLAGAGGVQVPPVLVAAAMAALCFALAYRDVQLSTIVMLALESVSVSIICVLIGIVFVKHAPAVDAAQFRLEGVRPSNVGLGIATAIFSLVGFESATAFGAEARRPLVTIPRAVLWSVVIASVFFIVAIYAEVLGLRSSPTPLDKLDAPLTALADLHNVGYLKIPITIGAMFSSFSVALACVSTCARIMLPMARDGFLPRGAGEVGRRYATPYAALAVTTAAMLAVALVMYALHVAPIDVFNFSGTLSAFGFIAIYLLITIAAVRYLRGTGELRARNVAVALAAIAFLVVPAVTLIYPVPPPPTNLFPYLFLGYLAAGWIGFALSRRRATRSA
ncbi:MAG: APC family permease [Candidatus Elarobacter sp.]